jgi:1,4-dihydroxy-2-naphthoate octaprenyltransferase
MSTVPAGKRQSTSAAWWFLAIRPKTLPAAVAPVLVGCAVGWAEGKFDLAVAAAALSVALLLQIGANLVNDVADFRRGADTSDRLGPPRVTQSGLLAPDQVLAAATFVLVAAAVSGLFLVWRGGPVLGAIGLVAIAAAIGYTAGPKPLGYLGLGELAVFVFFGPVAVVGTAYTMIHSVTALAIASSIPLGCSVTAILVVNNLRDLETDRGVGKRTLAVRIGRAATRWEYAALLAVAYLTPLVMWLSGVTAIWALLTWVTAPIAALLAYRVWTVNGEALNPVLAGTARLCLWFAFTFGAGIAL